MIIPKGVNHLEFLELAKNKGIKIQSRFTGVSFNLNHKAPSWQVRVQSNHKNLLFKRYPFTEKGESDAARHYERFIKSKDNS